MPSKKRKINKIKKRYSWPNLKKKLFSKETLRALLVMAMVFVAMILLVFGWVAKDLPSPDKVNDRLIAESTVIYAANNEPIWEIHGEKNRTLVSFEEMPDYLKIATVAIEDKDFYFHNGFNVKRTVKALLENYRAKEKVQGGSTITQQLIKNAILSPEKTYTRKIKELILAIEIEQMYSKDDILKMYLNEIPYGMNAYGVEAASKTFFDKKISELKEKNPENLARCVMLASLPNAPTYFSPYGQNYNELLNRKNSIMDLMVEQGKISKDEALAAKKIDIKQLTINRSSIDGYGDIKYPHFAIYIKEKLVEKYGERMATQGGLRVHTTLDVEKQNYALSLLDPKKDKFGHVKRIKSWNATNASLISLDPNTGNILAMVGSLDFRNEKIDGYVNITTAARQPGSSFKPLVYATAWKKNWGPGSTIYDLTTDFGNGYKPANYDGVPKGLQSMRSALAGSLNISAVKTIYLGGVQETIDTAHDLGITDLKRGANFYGLPLSLGTGEVKPIDLASAYGTFANMGERHELNWYTKITDSKGTIIDEYKPSKGKQAINSEIAYSINNVLSDNAARSSVFGSNNYLNIPGKKISAKTGTTESNHDAWTAGYSRNIATVVWVGNNDNSAMKKGADGSIVAAPIWNAYMKKYADNIGWAKEKPKGIKWVELDSITGKKPEKGALVRKDIFPSWYKIEGAGGQTSVYKIDTISKKLATDNCPDEAVSEVKVAKVVAEIPPNDPSFSRWNAAVAAWASARGYSTGSIVVPTEHCDIHDGSNLPGITLSNSWYKGIELSGSFTVKTSVVAPRGVNKVIIYVGEKAFSATKNGTHYSATVTATPGQHTIKAKVWDTAMYSSISEEILVNVTEAKISLDLKMSGNYLKATPSNNKITSVTFYGLDFSGNPKSIGSDSTGSNGEFSIRFTNNGTYASVYAIGKPSNVMSNEIRL